MSARAVERYSGSVTSQELDTLAADWIKYQLAAKGSVDRKETWYAVEMAFDLVDSDPETLWKLVLAVLEKDRSNIILQNLAAGPMEDLLVKHGAMIIESIERQAQDDEIFASMLGGVWQNRMSDDAWDRVRKVWNRRGWDGLPE